MFSIVANHRYITNASSELLPHPHCRNATTGRLPAGFAIPPFPRDLQTKLENKEPCQKSSKDGHRIIRVFHEAMIEHKQCKSATCKAT